MNFFELGKKQRGKSKSRIGLDIGTDSVKLVEVSRAGDGYKLTACGYRRLAGLAKQEVSGAVKSLVEESKVSSREAVVSVAGPSVIVRFISLPRMKDEELRSAVKFEAEKFIPFNINDCIIDYQVLNRDGKDPKVSVLLTAARIESVQDKIKTVEGAGLTVSVVDVDSFALTNAFLTNFPGLEAEKTVALLNIGATYSNLSVIRSNMISFVRDIGIGGDDFNAAISKALVIAPEEADELKRGVGERAQEIAVGVKPVLNNLLDEVKLSFTYHENQSGRGVDEVFISGGSVNLPGLEEVFTETLGSKPSPWDPFKFVAAEGQSGAGGPSTDRPGALFCVAAGLALR